MVSDHALELGLETRESDPYLHMVVDMGPSIGRPIALKPPVQLFLGYHSAVQMSKPEIPQARTRNSEVQLSSVGDFGPLCNESQHTRTYGQTPRKPKRPSPA